LAAARLLAEGGSGKRVIELAGPREYSPRDVAAGLGHVIGKPIVTHQEPEDAMAAALMGAGMNAEWARLFEELTHGVNTGRVAWEGGHPLWRGETDVEAVLATLVGGAK
jgi:NAD(P)H dehydrogenase (quinone)